MHLDRLPEMLAGFATLAALAIAPQLALGQPAQPHPLEAEYKNLATIHRALSACPNLIEEWELAEVSSRKLSVKLELQRLMGDDLPAPFERDIIVEAAATNCANPQLRGLAETVRRSSQILWKARYEVISNEGACMEILQQRPDVIRDIELFDRGLDGLLGTSAEIRNELRQEAARLEAPIIQSCDHSRHKKRDGIPAYNAQVHAVTDPIDDAGRRAKDQKVERRFDLNKGWSLGYGDTVKRGHDRRHTIVTATRTLKPSISQEVMGDVIIGKAACGQYTVGGGALNAPQHCSLIVRRDGGMGIITYLYGAPNEYKGDAVLRVYNPADSKVVLTLKPVKRDDVQLLFNQDGPRNQDAIFRGVTYFEDVLGQIESLHPLMQLNVSLIDATGAELSLVSETEGQAFPQTVSVADIRQAHSFAYATKEDDLTLNGLTKAFYETRVEARPN